MVCIFAVCIYVYVNVSLTMPNVSRAAAAQVYTITELAAEFDITARAIRFYEDVGLLTPARAGRNQQQGRRQWERKFHAGNLTGASLSRWPVGPAPLMPFLQPGDIRPGRPRLDQG